MKELPSLIGLLGVLPAESIIVRGNKGQIEQRKACLYFRREYIWGVFGEGSWMGCVHRREKGVEGPVGREVGEGYSGTIPSLYSIYHIPSPLSDIYSLSCFLCILCALSSLSLYSIALSSSHLSHLHLACGSLCHVHLTSVLCVGSLACPGFLLLSVVVWSWQIMWREARAGSHDDADEASCRLVGPRWDGEEEDAAASGSHVVCGIADSGRMRMAVVLVAGVGSRGLQ